MKSIKKPKSRFKRYRENNQFREPAPVVKFKQKPVALPVNIKPGITHDRLISAGFMLKMNIYSRDGFSVSLYKHIWKCCCGRSPEFDITEMDQLYNKYLELTGNKFPVNQ